MNNINNNENVFNIEKRFFSTRIILHMCSVVMVTLTLVYIIYMIISHLTANNIKHINIHSNDIVNDCNINKQYKGTIL